MTTDRPYRQALTRGRGAAAARGSGGARSSTRGSSRSASACSSAARAAVGGHRWGGPLAVRAPACRSRRLEPGGSADGGASRPIDVAPRRRRRAERPEVAADRDRDEHLAAAEERADVLARVDAARSAPANAAGRRARSASARIRSSFGGGCGRARAAPAQLPVDRAAVVRVDEREEGQLVALVDVRARPARSA